MPTSFAAASSACATWVRFSDDSTRQPVMSCGTLVTATGTASAGLPVSANHAFLGATKSQRKVYVPGVFGAMSHAPKVISPFTATSLGIAVRRSSTSGRPSGESTKTTVAQYGSSRSSSHSRMGRPATGKSTYFDR